MELYFILASASPRRRELLESLGVSVLVLSPGAMAVDETPRPDESPVALVQRLSREKAEAGVAALPLTSPGQAALVAADTVVVLADTILGKPHTPAAAIHMLQQLRQKEHQVYSGLTIALPSPTAPPRFITRFHHSRVWLRPYSDAEIAAYVAGGSPLDKAGAYGIQDVDFAPVARLEGCFASVMGLPLGELAAALDEAGLPCPAVGPACTRLTGRSCCMEGLPNPRNAPQNS
jgi:septum formation protein